MEDGRVDRRTLAQKYPPLIVTPIALLIVLVVLPSALNIPQSNPTETLEYAPVPPEDSDAPPQQGNLSSLGLGGSSSLTSGVAPPVAPPGVSSTPSAKKCVGNPPRQTEDPMAPPCVSFFEGDNFGATYQGVTREEIKILIYVDGNYSDGGSRGLTGRESGKFFDLAEPPQENESYFVEAGRLWQRYFNERFQTYGRFAHFYLTFATGQSPEARRADGVESYSRIKPFATMVVDTPYQSSVPYVEFMARRGVLNFGIVSERPQALYTKFPKLEWGYFPSLERHVDQFTDHVCNRVVGHPVSFGGNDGSPDSRLHNGQPRRLGLLSTVDRNRETQQLFAKLAREKIEACGGNFVSSHTFPFAGFFCCSGSNQQAGADGAVKFRDAGVTTIVWAQGWAPEFTQGFASAGDYRPEWVVAGDRQLEDLVGAKYQEPSVWDHAMTVTNITLSGPRQKEQCYIAAKEADPDLPLADTAIPCRMYEDLRQLFIGIQVAGPRLGPTSIDKGFRAIPNRPSGSPTIPACFYEPGDYTCVKDSIAMHWDSSARSTYSSAAGCYRVPLGGKRFLQGNWPNTEASKDFKNDDVCNSWTSGQTLDPSPGSESAPPQ